jgi:hypothetical protein
VTQKGKGYAPAEASADKYHGVNKFDVVTGAQAKRKPTRRPTPSVFAESLIAGSARRRQDRRRHRRDAVRAPASTCSARRFRRAASTSALPSSMP